MSTVFDVANFFLATAKNDPDDEGAGDKMTHMKLQKLVYYAQGLHLAVTGRPLFEEPIEAWEHGPVCPKLYQEYKGSGKKPIEINSDIDDVKAKFSYVEMSVMLIINLYFSCYTASKLRQLSHKDKAWKDFSSNGTNSKTAISYESLSESCKQRFLKELRVTIETELDSNGMTVAEVMEMPGAIAWDLSPEKAKNNALSIAFDYIADQIENGEFDINILANKTDNECDIL
jgi:uncharacterized phage-associated protein